MVKIMDGKALGKEIRNRCAEQGKKLSRKPGLAAVLIGDNKASEIYVTNKKKACEKANFYSEIHKLGQDVSEREVYELLDKLNNNTKIDGILVQLPLPDHLDENKILQKISPDKDVDGFHPLNYGELMAGQEKIIPATPLGIINLLEKYDIKISGSNAVVVGRSKIVGRPVAALLTNRNATVTICHSKTKDLEDHCKKADILITAVGKPGLIKSNFVKDNAAVIDVGITKINGEIKGDVDFESVKNCVGFITPVPGGVGPMTIALLLQNTLKLSELHQNV